MENRSFIWNSVRLEVPNCETQLQRKTSPFEIPVRHVQQLEPLCSPESGTKEECHLKAFDEEDQPLLRSREPNGSALQNPKTTGGCTRNPRVPRLAIPKTIPQTIPQKKRTRSLSGLVASNDFFIPCPVTPSSLYPPSSCTGRDTIMQQTPRMQQTPMMSQTPRMLETPRTPRKEVLADSLRGQYTPRNCTKGGVDLGRKGNWTAGFLERAIRARERCTGSRLPRLVYHQNVPNVTNGGTATDLEKKLQEQGITPVYYPEPRCEVKRFGNLASMISDLRLFLTRPVPQHYGPIECHIRRHVHAKWLTPSYRLHLSDGNRFLLSSKKRKKAKTNYTISLDENDISKQSGNYFGKLRSNFVGSEYWFYDKGTPPMQVAGVCGAMRLPTTKNRVEMGAVKYHVNVLGIGGPRKMTAIIPSLQEDGKPHIFHPAVDGGPIILDDYKCGEHRDKMIIMHNKQPHFNKQLAAYCLNFNGRVTKPSVKNFQLVADSDNDTVILQFGKIGRNLFTMDYQHPMSALQAFSICLSSLDPKLACE